MSEKPKRKVEDFDIEPQTPEDYIKFIYHDVKAMKSVMFGPKGVKTRLERLETILACAGWIIGLLISIGSIYVGIKFGNK